MGKAHHIKIFIKCTHWYLSLTNDGIQNQKKNMEQEYPGNVYIYTMFLMSVYVLGKSVQRFKRSFAHKLFITSFNKWPKNLRAKESKLSDNNGTIFSG